RDRRRQLPDPVRRRSRPPDAAVLSRRIHLRLDRALAGGARPAADPERTGPFPGAARASARRTLLALPRSRARLSPDAGRERAGDVPRGDPGLPADPA